MAVSGQEANRRQTIAAIGAALWIVAGIAYVVLEAATAVDYEGGYSYAANYISDLGVPAASPRAVLMNAAFFLRGILFLAGAALIVRAFARPKGRLFLSLAAIHAMGLILVGTVHSGPAETANGSIRWHLLGATLALVGSNVAILAGAALARHVGGPSWYRAVSITIGILGLLSLVMLVVDRANSAISVLPEGAWERGSAYPINVWEVFTGVCLLAFGRRHN